MNVVHVRDTNCIVEVDVGGEGERDCVSSSSSSSSSGSSRGGGGEASGGWVVMGRRGEVGALYLAEAKLGQGWQLSV